MHEKVAKMMSLPLSFPSPLLSASLLSAPIDPPRGPSGVGEGGGGGLVGGLLSLVLWPSPLPPPARGRDGLRPSHPLHSLLSFSLYAYLSCPSRPVPSRPARVAVGWFSIFSRPHPVLCLFFGWGCFSGGPSPPHFTRILVKGGGWSWVAFPSGVPFPSPPDRVCG